MDITLHVQQDYSEPDWSDRGWLCRCDYPTFEVRASDREKAANEGRGVALCAVGTFSTVPGTIRFLEVD